MFKWTDAESIKCIIIDTDTVQEEYIKYDYSKAINNIKIIKISKDDNRFFKYFALSQVLNYIIGELNITSSHIVALTNSLDMIKDLLKYHIGTIETSRNIEFDDSYLSDFFVYSINDLNDVLTGKFVGYGAEAIAEGNIKNKIKTYRTFNIPLENGKEYSVYYSGRYYPIKHEYFKDDILSKVIFNFKNSYQIIIDSYYNSILKKLISINKEKDIVFTYVPLKPKQIENGKFNRFESLKLEILAEYNLKLENKIIKCIKDFEQKDPFSNREENVKNAFELINDVKDKTIFVLDDIYTSGATAKEIAKTFFAGGAKEVNIVAIAKTQSVKNDLYKYKRKECESCGGDLVLKYSEKRGNYFFGCSNYNINKCINTKSIKEGLRNIKKVNEIPLDDDSDLEEIY